MRHSIFSALLAVTALAACSTEDPSVPAASQAAGSPAAETQPANSTPAAQDPASDFAPLTSRDRSGGGANISAPGADFTLPAGWISEPPSSSMRLAQAKIPGDAGEGQLTVFYFGPGGGGGVEPNLQRWIGQVELDAEPQRESFTHGAFTITWVDAVGTLKPSTMGTGPTTPQPGSRLLAAVVEGSQGPWFFKASGPAATLEAERAAFIDMLKSATANG